jgi:uncharacterized protein YoxC
MKLDIKTIITLVTFAATMGGFYYSTQLRLDQLESDMDSMTSELDAVKSDNAKTLKKVKNLRKSVNGLSK